MAIKTFDEVVVDMLSHVGVLFPDANLSEGTFNREVFVDSPANEIATAYSEISIAQAGQSIRDASGIQLDRLLANWALYRMPATKATGTIYFRMRNAPTSDINVPSGTRLSTPATAYLNSVEFVTTGTVIMYSDPVIVSRYWNPNDRVYAISCSIQAVKAGTSSNVGPRTITIPTGVVTVDYIMNLTATSGGMDQESDDNFRTRGLTILQGIGTGTLSNYKALVESYTGVNRAVVVDSEDRDMIRAKDGGGIDIWIDTTVLSEATDTYNYVSGIDHVFIYRPVLEIASVTVAGGAVYPGVNYNLTKDTDAFGRSMYSRDRIYWIVEPNPNAEIVIIYSYCSLVRSLQGTVMGDTNRCAGANIVIKKAYNAIINITMSVEVLPGYDTSVITTAVNIALSSFIASLDLGEDVQQSDIIAVAEGVVGVDSVAIPLTLFDVVREDSDGASDNADYILGVRQTDYTTGNLLMRRFDNPTVGSISVNVVGV